MKKLLLLPTLLLASCSMSGPTAPFKAGDTFIVSGRTKDGVNTNFTAVLRDNGKFEDNYWQYDADGSSTDSALLVAKSSQDYVYAKDYFESADGKTDMIVGCYAYPGGPGGKHATCFLSREMRADYDAFWKRISGMKVNGLRFELSKTAGDCMITRK